VKTKKIINMKTVRILNYVFVIALGFFAVMFGIDRFGNNSRQSGDTTLYTEEYCKDIVGFNDIIPLQINMEDGKIASIVILDNKETPRFLDKVENAALVERFYGLTPAEAIHLDVDAVSGATYSSDAIIESVKTRMAIYDKETSPSPWTWQLFGIIGCAIILLVLSIIGKQKARN